MIIKFIVLIAFFTVFALAGCSGNKPERLSERELALLAEIESSAQSTPEPAPPPARDSSSTPSASVSIPVEQAAPKKKTAQAATDIVEIKEKMFIAQTNDIYINKDDYLGKTIKYEGLFDQSTWKGNGKTYRYVIRFGPGCCPGDAAAAGFEVVWDKSYPKKNDWVEAVGVLEEYEDDGIPNLRLALTSLTVLAKRGKEKVIR
jgi:hypothetical protein